MFIRCLIRCNILCLWFKHQTVIAFMFFLFSSAHAPKWERFRDYSGSGNRKQESMIVPNPRSRLKVGSFRMEKVRISDGKDVELGKYPFMGIFVSEVGSCGTTIITPFTTLTSCYCLILVPWFGFKYPHKLQEPESVAVFAGSVNMSNPRGQFRTGKRLRVHPKCILTESYLAYDYGMVELMEPFITEFGDVQVIKLPDFQSTSLIDSMVKTEAPCVVMGWGASSPEGLTTLPTLKEFSAKLKNKDWCSKQNPSKELQNENICASSDGASQSVCDADNGSPLLCGTGEKQLIAVVALTTNLDCGVTILPTIGSRLDVVTSWIYSVLEEQVNYSTASTLHYDSISISIFVLPFMICVSGMVTM